MDMASIIERMEGSIKGSGSRIKCMDRDLFFGLMAGRIKDSM